MDYISARCIRSRFLFLQKGEKLSDDFLENARIGTIYPQEDRDIIEYTTNEDDIILKNSDNFKELRDGIKKIIKRLEDEVERLLREEDITIVNNPFYNSVPETEKEKKERQKNARIKRVAVEETLYKLKHIMEGFNGD